MSLPVPPLATRASPPIAKRSDRPHYWPPSVLVYPHSVWNRWSPSSPRGSTRRRIKANSDGALINRDRGNVCAWMRVNVMELKPRGERVMRDCSGSSPLRFSFLFVWFADKYDKLLRVWVSCMQSMCLRRKHFGRCTELLRLGEIASAGRVDGRSFRAPMETRVGDEPIMNRRSSRTRARLASLIQFCLAL